MQFFSGWILKGKFERKNLGSVIERWHLVGHWIGSECTKWQVLLAETGSSVKKNLESLHHPIFRSRFNPQLSVKEPRPVVELKHPQPSKKKEKYHSTWSKQRENARISSFMSNRRSCPPSPPPPNKISNGTKDMNVTPDNKCLKTQFWNKAETTPWCEHGLEWGIKKAIENVGIVEDDSWKGIENAMC